MKFSKVGLFLLTFVPALVHAQASSGMATRPRTVSPSTTPTVTRQQVAPRSSTTTPIPVPVLKQQPAPTIGPQRSGPAGTTGAQQPATSVPANMPPLVTPTPVVILAPLQPAHPLPASKVRTDIETAARALKSR